MDISDLYKLKKSELIALLLNQNERLIPTPRRIRPIPAPRKSVKQMVKDYEDNIIFPPPEFRDDYKPVPALRTKKTVPAPKTKIEQTDKALKG